MWWQVLASARKYSQVLPTIYEYLKVLAASRRAANSSGRLSLILTRCTSSGHLNSCDDKDDDDVDNDGDDDDDDGVP